MHDDNAPAGRSNRQRAACDRCHALKNRCVRSTNRDHKCERCRRLGLDCTYSPKSRMGRPKGRDKSQGNQWKPAIAHDASPYSYEEFTSSEQSSNRDSAPFREVASSGASLDTSLHKLNELDTEYNVGLSLPSTADGFGWDFETLEYDERPLPAFEACQEPSMDFGNALPSPPQSESRQIRMTDHAQGNINPCEKIPITQQLVQLQTTLQTLYSAQDGSNPVEKNPTHAQQRDSETSSLSEVLVHTEELTNIVKYLSVYSARRSHPSEGSGRSPNNDEDPLVMLHILTCYQYLLRLLEPVIQNDHTSTSRFSCTLQRGESTPALSLGIFSLASQPELNARVTATLIREMINSLHNTLRPQVDNLQAQHQPCIGFSSLIDETPNRNMGNDDKDVSPMINAASLMVQSMRVKEEQLLRQLQIL